MDHRCSLNRFKCEVETQNMDFDKTRNMECHQDQVKPLVVLPVVTKPQTKLVTRILQMYIRISYVIIIMRNIIL